MRQHVWLCGIPCVKELPATACRGAAQVMKELGRPGSIVSIASAGGTFPMPQVGWEV